MEKQNTQSSQIHLGQSRRPCLLEVLNRGLCKKLCLVLIWSPKMDQDQYN